MTIPSWAVKGAKVVCVDGAPVVCGCGGEATPVRGAIYTIRDADADIGDVQLVEIINAPRHYSDGYYECWYDVSRFRPLVADKTEAEDVALFRHHLDHRMPETA